MAFSKEPGEILGPQCAVCKNFIGFQMGVNKCKAFDNIPPELLFGDVKHNKEIPGDKGFRFEPIDGTA